MVADLSKVSTKTYIFLVNLFYLLKNNDKKWKTARSLSLKIEKTLEDRLLSGINYIEFLTVSSENKYTVHMNNDTQSRFDYSGQGGIGIHPESLAKIALSEIA